MAKEMIAKYPGTCAGCGDEIEVGTQIVWYGQGEAYHSDCRPQGGTLKEHSDPFGHLFEHPNGGMEA